MAAIVGARASRRRDLAGLESGDHVLVVVSSDEERVETLAGYLQTGVERHERIICAVNGDLGELTRALVASALPVQDLLERGQLEFCRPSDLHAPSGSLETEQSLRLFRDAATKAGEDGFTGLRCYGENLGFTKSGRDLSELLVHECAFDRGVLERARGTVLCLYDRRRVSKHVISAALAAHPYWATATDADDDLFRDISEERLRALLDATQEQAFLIAPDGMILAGNRAFGARAGRAPEDLVGTSVWALMEPEFVAQRASYVQQVVETGTPVVFEDCRKELTLVNSLSPIANARGEVEAIAVFALDVSALRAAEGALHRSQAHLESALAAGDLCTWEWDLRSDTLTFSDPEWLPRLGVDQPGSPGEVERYRELVDARDLERIDDAFQAHVAGDETSFEFEYGVRGIDGEVRWIWSAGRCIEWSEGGDPVLCVGTSRDVTESKRARDEEAVFEGRFREMLERLRLINVFLDLEGRVTYANPALLALTGWTKEEAIGVEWFENFLPPEIRDEIRSMFLTSLEQGVIPARYDNQIVTRTGERRMIRWSNTVLRDARGRSLGVASVGEDMTDLLRAEAERERLQESIARVQKLESLGVLAGGIAHDFNNLLVGILGNVDILAEKVSGDPEAGAALDMMRSTADKAAGLCKQMLAYAGEGSAGEHSECINEVVRDMMPLLGSSISKKSRIALELAADLPHVAVDASQLRQVVLNLVINASESFEGSPGQISIRSWWNDLSEAALAATYLDDGLPAGRYVVLEISDDGQGMTEEVRARIFDPFFSTKFTGRGMGLAGVMGIIRAHGGAVDVSSAPGEGTRIRVYFPALETRARRPPQAAGAHELIRGEGRVLVVDDEEPVRIVAGRMLRKLGFEVVSCACGSDALELLHESAGGFRLVLLDLLMPDMDGDEVLREIRGKGIQIPVVLSSGYSQQIAQKRDLALDGHLAFLQKPYRLAALSAAIAPLLDT